MEGEQGLGSLSAKQQDSTMSFSDWADSMCPYYMMLGVSSDDYWHGDHTYLPFYVEAHELANEQRNQEMWLQGLYIHDAVHVAIYNLLREKNKEQEFYPKEPYPLTKEELEARAERDIKSSLQNAKAKFEAWSETLEIQKDGDMSDN